MSVSQTATELLFIFLQNTINKDVINMYVLMEDVAPAYSVLHLDREQTSAKLSQSAAKQREAVNNVQK